MSIQVEMLGKARVLKDGNPVVFPYRKAEGLFYYLVVKQTVTRDEVISIFWTDCSEDTARKNLRDALYHLKKMFGKDIIASQGKNIISLDLSQIDSIDYAQLTDGNMLQKYKGDFLGYFYVKNCPMFEDWTVAIGDDLRQSYYKAALKQIEDACSKSNKQDVLIKLGKTFIERKLSYTKLIRLILVKLLTVGYYDEAQELYTGYAQMLAKEYEEEPDKSIKEIMSADYLLKVKRNNSQSGSDNGEIFFCRENELAIINENFHGFLDGKPYTSLMLTGEAGVGKSAILHKVYDGLEKTKYAVLAYQCIQTEKELYLKPWNDILAQINDLNKNFSAGDTSAEPILNSQVDSNIFATQYEMHIKQSLEKLVSNLKGEKIILIIDDIQWMDYASMRLLSNILFWGSKGKLLAIVACRNKLPDESFKITSLLKEKDLLKEVAISRFTYEESSNIITTYLPDLTNKKADIDKIYQSTAGNALFLLEFLKDCEHSSGEAVLSKKAIVMIQSRLSELAKEDVNLLETISLFQRYATITDMQLFDKRSTELLLEGIEKLLQCHLIYFNSTYNGEGYSFSHQIIQEYVYDSLLKDRKIFMHATIAAHYEAQFLTTHDVSIYPSLIYHFGRSNNIYKAYNYQLEYLCSLYTVQNEIYPSVLTTKQATTIPFMPLKESDGLVALAKKIRSLSPDVDKSDLLKMKLEFLIGRYDLFSGAFEHGLENIAASIAIAKKRKDSEYLLKDYLQMVFHSIQINNLKMFDDYITLCEELVEKYTYSESDICVVMRLRGLYYMKNFRYKEAVRTFQKVIKRLEVLYDGDKSCTIALAACFNYIGECKQSSDLPDEALAYFLKAIQYSETETNFSGLCIFYYNAGQLYYHLNKLDKSAQYIDAAMDCVKKTDALWGRARILCYKSLLEIKAHNLKKAKEYYKRACELAKIGKNPIALSLLNDVENQIKSADKTK